jgi:hypothetical protein
MRGFKKDWFKAVRCCLAEGRGSVSPTALSDYVAHLAAKWENEEIQAGGTHPCPSLLLIGF